MTVRRQSRAWLIVLALLLVGGVLAALLLPAYDDSLARVKNRGVLRVGYAVEAPYAMVEGNGRMLGESPATARLIAERMGVRKIEWVQVPFASLIPNLLARQYDVIAAGMFITPERARQVSFSTPTLRVGSGLLVRRGNPRRLTSYDSLAEMRGVRVAVLDGAVEMERLQRMGLKPDKLVVVQDANAGVAAVAIGNVDALALSLPTVRWIAMTHGNRFEAVAGMPGAAYVADHVAMAFHPDDKALLRAWNAAAAGVVGSPEHLAAIALFGFEAEEMPAPPARPE